ncbi:MAG: CTP synthase [Candidatus Woesebacteria bacterium]|jgi:CTP synthase
MKYIIVSGGVLSGLGKGVTAASIGLLLKSRGIDVTMIKCDMYLNIDAGTMNPIEHGEVFVTHDGIETDQDLGHYERFIDETATKENYLTNGQVYKYVLDKERSLDYDGACVQPYHHIPPEIIKRWKLAGEVHNAEVVIIEMGGTVGEYEGLLFFEAVRRLKLDAGKDVCLVHVGYLPAPPSIGELKSKPIQQSVSNLNSLGLSPDFIVARAERKVDKKRKEKIALASGLTVENIISNEDAESVYEVPLILDKQSLATKIIKLLSLKSKNRDMKEWREMVKRQKKAKGKVKIAMVGKYQKTGDYMLEDSYVCVVEALKHASLEFDSTPEIVWIDSEKLEEDEADEIEKLNGVEGIIVPQGWGKRGFEGKVKAVNFARENKVPYLGLCYGMQVSVVEFARNVLGLKEANSQEVNSRTKDPVIHIMPDQKKYLEKRQYGGTIRLGAWPCKIKPETKLEKAYKKYGNGMSNAWYEKNPRSKTRIKPKKARLIFERHRHRYEFNNKYKKRFEKNGMVVSGTSPDGKLVEAVEIKDHPFFVGTQFHPEYLSRPLSPHPIFISFIEAVTKAV